ncbi:hypothetical protein BGZ58_007962 [Dissophora ornata]|nr:hypothetical protein BGZ58_007962 [Dissophora ornata]
MTAVPTLPFVVLKAHKPWPHSDNISTTATSQVPNLALTASLPAATSAGLGTGAIASSSPMSPNILRTGSIGHMPSSPNPANISGSLGTSSPGPSIPSVIQTRTLHPQVHYIFENDPLEHDILESIPKSRCITLDLDPRSGSIKNVESFLTDLQVMDVKLVLFQAALTTSSTSSSLNSLAANMTMNNNNNVSNSVQQQGNDGHGGGGSNHTTAMGKVTSPGASSLQFSATISTTRMTRHPSERSLVSQIGEGDSQSIKSAKSEDKVPTPTNSTGAKDWTLVIETVEVDERDQERYTCLLLSVVLFYIAL